MSKIKYNFPPPRDPVYSGTITPENLQRMQSAVVDIRHDRSASMLKELLVAYEKLQKDNLRLQDQIQFLLVEAESRDPFAYGES